MVLQTLTVKELREQLDNWDDDLPVAVTSDHSDYDTTPLIGLSKLSKKYARIEEFDSDSGYVLSNQQIDEWTNKSNIEVLVLNMG